MKKLLLTLGAVASVAAPVAAVVACGSNDGSDRLKDVTFNKTATKTVDAIGGDGKVIVNVKVDADDFEAHIAGEAGLAIENLLSTKAKTVTDIKEVTIIATNDDTKYVSATLAVSTDGLTEIKTYPVIWTALEKVSEKIAEANVFDHDLSENSSDYNSKMLERVNAVNKSGDDWEFANDLLEAIGNPTRFTDATTIKPVFAQSLVINKIGASTTPSRNTKTYMKQELKLKSFGALSSDIYDALLVKAETMSNPSLTTKVAKDISKIDVADVERRTTVNGIEVALGINPIPGLLPSLATSDVHFDKTTGELSFKAAGNKEFEFKILSA